MHVIINTDMGFAFDNLDTLPDAETGVTAVVQVDLDENKKAATYKFLNSKQVKDFMQDQVDYTNEWDMYFRETRPNRVYWTTCEKSQKDAEAFLKMFCLNKITNDIYLYTEGCCFHDQDYRPQINKFLGEGLTIELNGKKWNPSSENSTDRGSLEEELDKLYSYDADAYDKAGVDTAYDPYAFSDSWTKTEDGMVNAAFAKYGQDPNVDFEEYAEAWADEADEDDDESSDEEDAEENSVDTSEDEAEDTSNHSDVVMADNTLTYSHNDDTVEVEFNSANGYTVYDETPNEDNDNISYIVDKDDSYDAAWCEFIPVDDADTYFQTYLDLADHWKKYYTRYESDDTLMFVIYEGGASEQYLEYYNAYKVSDDVIFLYHGWYTLGSDMDDFIETHRKSCQEAFTVKVNGHVWKPTAKERKASKSLNKSIDKLVSSKTKTITSDVTKGLDIYGKHHKE